MCHGAVERPGAWHALQFMGAQVPFPVGTPGERRGIERMWSAADVEVTSRVTLPKVAQYVERVVQAKLGVPGVKEKL